MILALKLRIEVGRAAFFIVADRQRRLRQPNQLHATDATHVLAESGGGRIRRSAVVFGFCSVAARWNSSPALVRPRNRMCSKPWNVWRCPKRISTRFPLATRHVAHVLVGRPAIESALPAEEPQRFCFLSKTKSPREKVLSSRRLLSQTGTCDAICFSFTSQPTKRPLP